MEGFPVNFQQIFEQAQQIQERVEAVHKDLDARTIEAGAGGGMVIVKVTGTGTIRSVKIDPEIFGSGDIEMVQDLVCAAVNEGLKKAKELGKAELGKITGGMPIPGFS